MRNVAGEIDLVCQKGKLLVFVEVKARSSYFDDILCTTSQQKRIKQAAEIFIQKNTKYNQYQIRFDLVIIRPYKFPKIIKNAW